MPSKANTNEQSRKTISIDEYVGNRLRMGRKLLGLTQSDLANMTGISFQQVQKYESGKNQVSAKRLHEFSEILKKSVLFFFEGYGGKYSSGEASEQFGFSDSAADKDVVYNELLKRDTVELLRGFSRVQDEQIRKKIIDIVNTLADGNEAKNKK